MGKFVRGQQVFAVDTGEIGIVSMVTGSGILLSHSDKPCNADCLLPYFQYWQQNTILDVGAKSLKELPAADKAARIANSAIELMINQAPPT